MDKNKINRKIRLFVLLMCIATIIIPHYGANMNANEVEENIQRVDANELVTKWDPENPTAFISQHDLDEALPTQLMEVVYTAETDSFTFKEMEGATHGLKYNALAYNTVDNYLYAVVKAIPKDSPYRVGQIIRIGSNMQVEGVGVLAGVAANNTPSGANAAAFGEGEDKNKMYLWRDNLTDNIVPYTDIFVVDLADEPENPDDLIPHKTAIKMNNKNRTYAQDFTYSKGYFWTMQKKTGEVSSAEARIGRIDPKTGEVKKYTLETSVKKDGAQYGAAWTNHDGSLMFSNNATGTVYQITLKEGADGVEPDVKNFKTYKGPSNTGNDGTSMPGWSPAVAKISGNVWVDMNHDSYMNETAFERRLENQEVFLLDNQNKVVASTQTDANGYYCFENVKVGNYQVVYKGSPYITTKKGEEGKGEPNLATSEVLEGENISIIKNIKLELDVNGDIAEVDNQNIGVLPEKTIKKEIKLEDGMYIGSEQTPIIIKEGEFVTYVITVNSTAVHELDVFREVTISDTVPKELTVDESSIKPTATLQEACITWENQVIEPGDNEFVFNADLLSEEIAINSAELAMPNESTLISNPTYVIRDEKDIPTGNISGMISTDLNYNGVLGDDKDERRMDGIEVKLYDSQNNLIATAITNEKGEYSFHGVVEGSYTIKTNKDNYDLTSMGNSSEYPVNKGDFEGGVSQIEVVLVNNDGVIVDSIENDFGFTPQLEITKEVKSYNSENKEVASGVSIVTNTDNKVEYIIRVHNKGENDKDILKGILIQDHLDNRYKILQTSPTATINQQDVSWVQDLAVGDTTFTIMVDWVNKDMEKTSTIENVATLIVKDKTIESNNTYVSITKKPIVVPEEKPKPEQLPSKATEEKPIPIIATGDTTNVKILIALVGMSGLGIYLVLHRNKQKSKVR